MARKDAWEQLPARTRGLVYLGGGVILAVVGAVLLGSFAKAGAASGIDATDPGSKKAIGLLGAPLALAMAGGISLVYIGLVKVALGARTDKLDWDRLTAVGLLYILGFAGALTATGYLVLIRWELHIF